MNDERLIIIGAGVAGLATACYARMNGYPVEVFELHNRPGGVCTSWARKDFVFDYCLHNLSGTSRHSDVARVWDELRALDGVEILNPASFVRIEGPDGQSLEWYTRLERLREHLLQLAPQDGRPIDRLIREARRFVGADPFAMALGGPWRAIKLLPRLPALARWSQVKLRELGARFRSPFLRRALGHVMYGMPGDEVPVLPLLLFMAGFEVGDMGWPVGGSLAFSERIARRLADLGGTVHNDARVERILVQDDRAVGVRLADGTEHHAGRVISAADGHSTIFGMLGGRYLTDDIRRYYGEADPSQSVPFGLVLCWGVAGRPPAAAFGESHALTLLFDRPLRLGNTSQDALHLSAFGPETGLAPPGKWVLKAEAWASYRWWKELRERDRRAYREEKRRAAQAVLERIAPRFPGLLDEIEIEDVSTPATAERYTANRFGWQPGPPKQHGTRIMLRGLSRTLPGLQRFHHVGHWSAATVGVSTVAMQGRSLVRELCRQDGRRFRVG